MIKNLNKGKPSFIVICQGVTEVKENGEFVYCENEYESMYNRGQIKKYIKEFGEWENHVSEPCPRCNTVISLDLNMADEELEESSFEEHEDMPEHEKEQRRVIKKLKQEFSYEEM